MKRCYRILTRSFLLGLSLAAATAAISAEARAMSSQRRGPSPGATANSLWGDFKVIGADDKKADTYEILLTDLGGNVIARQTISDGGRYRFLNVNNGDFYLVVESKGAQLARMFLRVEPIRNTDVRQDIELKLEGDKPANAGGKPGIISAEDAYHRSDTNQKLFDSALKAVQKKDNKQAISLLNQIVQSDPQDFWAWTELGTAYFKEKKSKEAESAYARAINEHARFSPALLNLGKLYLTNSNFQAAIDTLSQAVEVIPRSAEANELLGEAYLQDKKGSKAVGYLNEALRLDPTGMADVHLLLARLYNGAGLKDRAAAEYVAFLKKKPDYPDRKKLEQYISENKKP